MVAFLFFLLLGSVEASPFRVLVFPHQGAYPTPQGKETVVSSVRVSSDADCSQSLAKLESDHRWAPVGNPILVSKSFHFTNSFRNRWKRYFGNGPTAYYFSCSKPFKVIRQSGLESFQYEGDFVVLFDQGSRSSPIKIINIVDSENYIQGVVPSEVGSGWPMESLKAQAVAARTYAWWTILDSRKSSRIYDLDDTIAYQAFLGMSRKTPETNQAVNETNNLVLKYAGKVIKAYFSADSGGVTEMEKNVFGEDLPYCQSKTELYDVSKSKTEWIKKIPYSELKIAFGSAIQSVEISPGDRNESGRVSYVTLKASDHQLIKVPGVQFRRTMKLRSTFFDLSTAIENGKPVLVLSGKGFGHGVGMAQVGAREYASQLGWTFDQIVKFYYTGVTLETITDDYSE